MKFKWIMGLYLVVFTIQIAQIQSALASEVDRNLEASVLKSGYAIRLLKPLPRRNSGCETIFRNGKVLDSCDPNFTLDPAIEGVMKTYCEWNLNTHYEKYNSAKWLESYFNPNPILISNVQVGFNHHDSDRTMIQKLKNIESIIYRWIEIDFNDQLSGSKLGSLKCYPSKLNQYGANKKIFGNLYYDYAETPIENTKKIKSGLDIGDILDQLDGYVEIMQTN